MFRFVPMKEMAKLYIKHSKQKKTLLRCGEHGLDLFLSVFRAESFTAVATAT